MNFLFSDDISLERIKYFSSILEQFKSDKKFKDCIKDVNVFITGDALYSLIDLRHHKFWNKILKNKFLNLFVDFYELTILGCQEHITFSKEYIKNYNISSKLTNKNQFWKTFIETSGLNQPKSAMGFFQFEGPYMHRTSVYSLRALEAAIKCDLIPEFYGYLDGVHMGHTSQKPSEFENIADKMQELKLLLSNKDSKFLMLACTRCGTARGYIKNEEQGEIIISEDVIPSFYFCSLNKVVYQFKRNHLIWNPNSAIIVNNQVVESSLEANPPKILLFITHSPYSSEWSFGGLSFGVACANEKIVTQIVFIEDGVYCLTGTHTISEEDKIFNIQEIIEATEDIEYLKYFVYAPSLLKRGQQISEKLKFINNINEKHLADFFFNAYNDNFYHKRIIFF